MEGARPFLDADFPGYAEAVARERLVRGAACLGINEKICGFEVKPLTAFHIRLLSLVRSPFLINGVTGEMLAGKPEIISDVMRFLWIVSPMFKSGDIEKKKWWQRKTEKDKFNSTFSPIVKLGIDIVCREILEYIEEAFLDAGEPSAGDKSYWEFEVEVSHELHEAYGYRVDFWNEMPVEKNPIHVPLKLIFQLRKIRRKWNNPDAVLQNKSEKIISLGLAAMNERDKLNGRK